MQMTHCYCCFPLRKAVGGKGRYLHIDIIAVHHTKAFSKEKAAWGSPGTEQTLQVLTTVDVTTTENTNYLPKQSSSIAAVAQRGILPQHPRGQPAIFYSFLFAHFKCWGKTKGGNDEIEKGFHCVPLHTEIKIQTNRIYLPSAAMLLTTVIIDPSWELALHRLLKTLTVTGSHQISRSRKRCCQNCVQHTVHTALHTGWALQGSCKQPKIHPQCQKRSPCKDKHAQEIMSSPGRNQTS